MNNFRTGYDGLQLIKESESLKLEAYLCPAKVWTVGYGHTATAKQGMRISEARAESLLLGDLRECEDAINKLVKVKLSQLQFDALVSLVFNIGVGAFKRSTLLRLLNEGNYDSVPAQLARWNKAGGKVLRGLVRRRDAEATLWVQGSATVAALLPQSVDSPEKPLAKSRTMIGSAVGVVGSGAVVIGESATGFANFVKESRDDLTVLGAPIETLLFVAAVAAVLGGLLAMWARFDDRRKGRI